MSYALYKFHKAILSLYGTDLEKKQWLASSYLHHIIHLRDTDLPEQVREPFHELRARLTCIPDANPNATLEETVDVMDNNEVNSIIDRIIVIYDMLRRHENTPVVT